MKSWEQRPFPYLSLGSLLLKIKRLRQLLLRLLLMSRRRWHCQ
jgi:hypothetical protein